MEVLLAVLLTGVVPDTGSQVIWMMDAGLGFLGWLVLDVSINVKIDVSGGFFKARMNRDRDDVTLRAPSPNHAAFHCTKQPLLI